MSSFYYCNDCKKAVDLKYPQAGTVLYGFNYEKHSKQVCKECGETNWEAKIDNDKHVV